jgi:hypothetical protein
MAPPAAVPAAPVHAALRFAPPGRFYSPIPDLAEASRYVARVFQADAVELPESICARRSSWRSGSVQPL